MAKAPLKEAAEAASPWRSDLPFVSVVATTGRSYWAIARKFTSEPSFIAKAELSAEEAAALVADPWIVVSEVPAPPPAAPKE